MYTPRVGLGALAPVSDWDNQTVWTGTIQGSGPYDLRFSTVGLNSGLRPADEQMANDLWEARGHCVRVEGSFSPSGAILVSGWAILPDGTEFTQGGVTYTCGEFKPKVGAPPPNPTPPVTSGGTVTTTAPIPTGVDPGSVPADGPTTSDAGGASGGGYSGGAGAGGGGGGGTYAGTGTLMANLPLFAGLGLLLAVLGRKRR